MFAIEKNKKEFAPIEKPKAKIRHVEDVIDTSFNKNKLKGKGGARREEDEHEEAHHEEEDQHYEEEHNEEEEAAPEE